MNQPSSIPAGYKGRCFEDAYHKAGPAKIPGILQCALYDLGGEGVAYHDTTPANEGAVLNSNPTHQRPHAGPYLWTFRNDEGVDISYVKDFADLNHPNLVTPPINVLYIGWTDDGEWTHYTIDVQEPGEYRILALYANQANTITFDLNGQHAATCKLPVNTGDYHSWNYAEIGQVRFPQKGLQLLRFNYGRGNNFAWFEFVKA